MGNIYNLTAQQDLELESRMHPSIGTGARELMKFTAWATNETDNQTFMFLGADVLALVALFVEQNYTWKGTRALDLEGDENV
jgi:hypothetical protein